MEQSASWSTDRTDHELAGCCLQVGLRDYARYGQLVLEGGRVDGRSIVPDGWFAVATRTQVQTGYAGRGYGYQWWTYEDGTFNAIGIHGQLIHIDPARRLVVVINSAWPVAGQAQHVRGRPSTVLEPPRVPARPRAKPGATPRRCESAGR